MLHERHPALSYEYRDHYTHNTSYFKLSLHDEVGISFFSYKTCQVPQPMILFPGEFVGQCNSLMVLYYTFVKDNSSDWSIFKTYTSI